MADYNELISTLRAHANKKKAAEMSAYMRDLFPFLGIAKPERAKLQKEFLKAAKKEDTVDWNFVKECWQLPEREFQYLALEYLRIKQAQLGASDITRLRALAIEKSWWDSIDQLDRIVGDIALRHPKVNKTLLKWSVDKNFWLRRIAIDHQLMRKDTTDTDLLEEILVNNLGQTEFFINKAIGWSLREYSKTDPDWVRSFIERHTDQMAALSIREASKYL